MVMAIEFKGPVDYTFRASVTVLKHAAMIGTSCTPVCRFWGRQLSHPER